MEDITPQNSRNKVTEVLQLAIDPPKEKLPQVTLLPTGGVLAFAGSKTVQQFGKPAYARNLRDNSSTSMEYLMLTIMEYNRSRGGMLLGGIMKLAQTELEVEATKQQGQGRVLKW